MEDEEASVGKSGVQLPSYTGVVLEGNVGQSSVNGMQAAGLTGLFVEPGEKLHVRPLFPKLL